MMIPIPPNHCVRDRQNNSPRGCELMQSMPGKQFGLIDVEMTVAPVVENPDMDSNHALTAPRATSANDEPSVNGPWNIPPSQYGNAPINTARGHTSATAAKASRSRNRMCVLRFVPNRSIIEPMNRERPAGIENALKASSQLSR